MVGGTHVGGGGQTVGGGVDGGGGHSGQSSQSSHSSHKVGRIDGGQIGHSPIGVNKSSGELDFGGAAKANEMLVINIVIKSDDLRLQIFKNDDCDK